ncbi:MAG: hypothetical protein WA944_10230 [Mycobacterium sp.]
MVVVVTVTTTLLLTRDGSNGSNSPIASPPPSTSVDAADIASADDHGPVGIITEDPSCAAWTPIGDTLAQQQAKGWNNRDPNVPASDWTADQRRQHLDVADAMLSTADQTVALAKLTPHRAVRELYEQSIAYWRAYANRIPDYTPRDDHLARVATSTSNALVWICSAITFKSAEARKPFVIDAPPPLQVSPVEDPSNPSPFMNDRLPVCEDWQSTAAQFGHATSEWLGIDPDLSASQWTPEQQAINVAATVTMRSNANQLQDLGIRSGNPIFQDFATLAAQYRRAYASALPSYTPADNYLASVASQLVAANAEACKAATG